MLSSHILNQVQCTVTEDLMDRNPQRNRRYSILEATELSMLEVTYICT